MKIVFFGRLVIFRKVGFDKKLSSLYLAAHLVKYVVIALIYNIVVSVFSRILTR